jgi:hypothetical protein
MLFLIPTQNASASQVVKIDEVVNQSLSGKFFDDHLADDLLPSGKLGALLFSSGSTDNYFEINPETFNEIEQMAGGYKLVNNQSGAGQELAKQWLIQFKAIAKFGHISALPYGNPSGYWVNRLSPHNANYSLTSNDESLNSFFGFKVNKITSYSDMSYYRINNNALSSYLALNETINKLALYLSDSQLEKLELSSNLILRPDLTDAQILNISLDQNTYALSLINQVHLSKGKFTITSAKEKIPVTVVNEFTRPVPVKLYLYPTNNKIRVPATISLTLPANSKTAVYIPVHAFSSGSSGFQISISDNRNNDLGTPVDYQLNAEVISPIVTWITTLAAVTLFVAVIFRNIKKLFLKKKNDTHV